MKKKKEEGGQSCVFCPKNNRQAFGLNDSETTLNIH